MTARHGLASSRRGLARVAAGGGVLAVLAVATAVSIASPIGTPPKGGTALAAAGALPPPVPVPHAAATSPARHSAAPLRLAALTPWDSPTTAYAPGVLAPGSGPAALPMPILIVDKLNNRLIVVDPHGRVRWQFPRPGDLAPGQTFLIPDDAFFSPDGREIVATQEDQQLVSVIDVASHRIVYRYGTPGAQGSGPNQLSNPDDAMMLPDGYIVSPDIQNCRILLLSPRTHSPVQVIGRTTTQCLHNPPIRWGSPNGAFPMRDNKYLITEINGDWVDAISLNGTLDWSTHPPGVNYPSDSNQIGPDRFLTVDYSSPGQVVVFDHTGRLIWRYAPSGAGSLDHPSLGLPLPNGDYLITDDFNHRVVVIDPRQNRIVWQYGSKGLPGAQPGRLDNPDGLDLVPPHSFLGTKAATIGLPTLPAVPGFTAVLP